jgi:hypothetical protein
MSVTSPMAWKVPRSLSLVTTEGSMSTRMVVTDEGLLVGRDVEVGREDAGRGRFGKPHPLLLDHLRALLPQAADNIIRNVG